MRRILAIDPGANGGFAWIDEDGIVHAQKMPDGMTAIADRIVELKHQGATEAVMEKVGGYMPGNSGPAAATFARHCGHLDATLYCAGLPCELVAPTVWQRPMNLPKDKKQRKAAIKETMQRRYPHLRVTLSTADALAILTYFLK